ncbi:MAG: energy-coupling factor ABC transporter permease [Elainella sp.]
MKRQRFFSLAATAGLGLYWLSSASPAYAMHIAEGFLPLPWAVFWWVVTLPCFAWGLRSLGQITRRNPELKLLLALSGAFTFVLSALKLPSVTGSCSHPTGTGLGTVLFGPMAMSVLAGLVLLFQAVLLAHGGLTTLGANAFSMAIVGPWVAFGVYQLVQATGRQRLALFLAAALGNLATYLVTSLQLALAFPAATGAALGGAALGGVALGGVGVAFLKFAGIFAITQVPLAVSEGLLTLLVWNWLQFYAGDELKTLKLLRGEVR